MITLYDILAFIAGLGLGHLIFRAWRWVMKKLREKRREGDDIA